MNKLTLTRFRYNDKETLGVLEVGGEKLYTLELPNKGNEQNVSCIPEGFYKLSPHGWDNTSVRFTKVWEIKDVANRSAILLHAGNTTKDTEGCVLVGTGIHSSNGESYVSNSKDALNLVRSLIGNNGGIIEIKSI